MCTEIRYNGKVYEVMGELRKGIGDDKVMVSAHYNLSVYLDDDCCLCPVDIDSTAELLKCSVNKDDPFIWEFVPFFDEPTN